MKKSVALFFGIGMLFAASANGQNSAAAKAFTNSGWFDGIKMTSKESGDYGRMEVFLTDNAGSWFALVTVAEGVLLRPVLVKADVTGKVYDHIAFTLPGDNGGRKFTGTLASKTSTLTLNEGGTRTVLKAKCYK